MTLTLTRSQRDALLGEIDLQVFCKTNLSIQELLNKLEWLDRFGTQIEIARQLDASEGDEPARESFAITLPDGALARELEALIGDIDGRLRDEAERMARGPRSAYAVTSSDEEREEFGELAEINRMLTDKELDTRVELDGIHELLPKRGNQQP